MLLIHPQQIVAEIGNLLLQVSKLLVISLNFPFGRADNPLCLKVCIFQNNFGLVPCFPNGSLSQLLGADEGIFNHILIFPIGLYPLGQHVQLFTSCSFSGFQGGDGFLLLDIGFQKLLIGFFYFIQKSIHIFWFISRRKTGFTKIRIDNVIQRQQCNNPLALSPVQLQVFVPGNS